MVVIILLIMIKTDITIKVDQFWVTRCTMRQYIRNRTRFDSLLNLYKIMIMLGFLCDGRLRLENLINEPNSRYRDIIHEESEKLAVWTESGKKI